MVPVTKDNKRLEGAYRILIRKLPCILTKRRKCQPKPFLERASTLINKLRHQHHQHDTYYSNRKLEKHSKANNS